MEQKTIECHEWNSLMNIFLSGALMRACRFQRSTEESEIFWGEHDANYLRGLRGTPRIASSIMKPSRREGSARVDDDRDEASLNFRASINDYPAGMVILSNVLNIILRSQPRDTARAFTVILSQQIRHRRSWASLLTSLVDEWIPCNISFVAAR